MADAGHRREGIFPVSSLRGMSAEGASKHVTESAGTTKVSGDMFYTRHVAPLHIFSWKIA